MADFSVAVIVTKQADGTFSWTFANSTESIDGRPFATVSAGTTKTIDITLQPGTPGDSVIFQSTPLVFTRPNSDPPWYSHSGQGTSVLTVTDNNTHPPELTQTWEFLIQATYTPSGSNGIDTTSPDPTIVNTGTGGDRYWMFPVAD